MKTLEIKLYNVDVEHLIENLIALTEYSGNLTDTEKEDIIRSCKEKNISNDKRNFIQIELPRNWEEIDPNHMYHSVTGFTFISDNVTQAEHDLVSNLCVAIEKLTGKEIKYTN